MNPEPRLTSDCAQCGKPRPKGVRTKGADGVGTRLDRAHWLANLERDPFCSARCCRVWYGLTVGPPPLDRGRCVDCDVKLGARRPHRSGPRCKACGVKARRVRHYDSPHTCVGCGCEFSTLTTGCSRCTERRRARERRTGSGAEPRRHCKCGVDFDGVTPGCRACHKRHQKRRYVAKRLGPAAVLGGSIEPPENRLSLRGADFAHTQEEAA